MKKIIIFIFALFIFPLISNASSVDETCFNHGGTNCIIGPDWDGSVICNDGWRDSFVFYSSSSECRDMECTASELNNLYSKHNIRENLERIQEINKEILTVQNDLMEEIKNIYNSSILSSVAEGKKAQAREEANDKIYSLELERSMLQSNIDIYLPDINIKCKALGQDRWVRLYREALEKEQAYEEQQRKDRQEEIDDLWEEANIRACNLIDNSIYKNGGCYCEVGYLISSDKSRCIKISEKQENVTPKPIEEKKEIKSKNNTCSNNQVLFNNLCIDIPENAHTIDSSTDAWSCNEGYKEIDNSCVLIENKIEKLEENTPIIENNNNDNNLIVEEKIQEEINNKPVNSSKENKIKRFFSNIFNTVLNWFK
jgi:hypothetical protein